MEIRLLRANRCAFGSASSIGQDANCTRLSSFGADKNDAVIKPAWILLFSSSANCRFGSIYAWSVFAAPMAAHLGLSTGELAIVFVIANGVGPITMIFGGKITEKIGAAKVIVIGGIMFSLGIAMSGYANSLGSLIFWYSLVSGLGLGMAYGCAITNTLRFFPDKRGLVGGLLTAVYGFSSVLIPPIANGLINSYGVLTAF